MISESHVCVNHIFYDELMVRRRSKRKAHEREEYMLKEQKKVEATLDKRTMVYLSKFYNKGIIGKLGFIIARGKESDVYIASAGDADIVKKEDFVIVKFFRIETSTFLNMTDYLIGDPRFKNIRKSKVDIIDIWCRKEFGNLEIARKAGVDAPTPYMFNGSILAMQFIGNKNEQAMQLKDTLLTKEQAEPVLDMIIEDMKKLYDAKLVHGDLSEYNILISNGIPFIIDFGQAVVLKHPNAMLFLKRDVKNVVDYFRKKYGINRDIDSIYSYITG